MLSIAVRNVNEAYSEGLWKMKIMGVDADSRNGKVKRILGPVATTYYKPTERMLTDPKRDANPFFHIFEGVWMLAGRNDVEFVQRFNSNIGQYSDDSKTLAGAYGYRWRNHWKRGNPGVQDHNQLFWLIDHLGKEPTSRRAVLQMFDPLTDQPWESGAKDIPCNTAAYFDIVEGALNMTVTCRSNDMIWGAYGANAVHMSMLQEFVAGALGVGVGFYTQFSNNFHMYEKHFDLLESPPAYEHVGYVPGHVAIVSSPERWRSELQSLENWCNDGLTDYNCPYILGVLNPMMDAWYAYKRKDRESARFNALRISDPEVAQACLGWLSRRKWE